MPFDQLGSIQLGNVKPELVADDSDEAKAKLQGFVQSRLARLDISLETHDISVSADGTITAYPKDASDQPEIDLDLPDDDGDNAHERDERESDANADEDDRTVFPAVASEAEKPKAKRHRTVTPVTPASAAHAHLRKDGE